jgi:hypothetical protein
MSLSLPADLVKNGNVRTVNTAAEYWTLFYDGYAAVDSEAGESQLTPQQKAARTRAANKAKEEQDTSNDGDTTAAAGDAAGGDDVSDAADQS